MVVKSQKYKRRIYRRGGYALLAILSFAVLLSKSVSVYAVAPRGGFTVSPAQLVFTLNAQNAEQTTELTILNNYDTDLHLSAELNNIDEASVNLLPAGPLSDAALSAAVSLSATDITVPGGGTYKLAVQVRDNAALQAGGHYASLVLTQQVSIASSQSYRSALAVNLFVIKAEGVRTDLQLLGVATKRWLFGLPTEVKLRFRNNGNVFVVPRASASVYSSDNTLLAQGVFNTESHLLFPEQEATYTAPMTHFQRLWLPQKLHMVVAYRIQGNDVQLESKQTFWYVPPIYLLIPVLPFAVLAILLGYKYRVAIARNVRKFALWLRRTIGRFARQVIPVTKRTASTIILALKRLYQRFLVYAEGRRAAYVAWRIKRAEEQAAIQAARDAVKAKPIDLWANTDFTDSHYDEFVPEPEAGIRAEREPLREQLNERGIAPEPYIEPQLPDHSIAEPDEEDEFTPVLSPFEPEPVSQAGKAKDESPVMAPDILAEVEPVQIEPEQPAPKPEQPQVPVEEPEVLVAEEPPKPPELPKYKPVDYPGLRQLGLMPASVPKPKPVKPAATGRGRVPQLVSSTKTTLPRAGAKKPAAGTKSGSKTAKKPAQKAPKSSATKSPKNDSSRAKSGNSTKK